MRPLTLTIAACLAAATLALAACGGDDKKSDSLEAVQNDAQKRCLEFAEQIENAEARESAKQGCLAVAEGDTEQLQQTGREEAKKACLASAAAITDSEARATAEARCEAITGDSGSTDEP